MARKPPTIDGHPVQAVYGWVAAYKHGEAWHLLSRTTRPTRGECKQDFEARPKLFPYPRDSAIQYVRVIMLPLIKKKNHNEEDA